MCSVADVHACSRTARVRVRIKLLNSRSFLHVWTRARHALMPVSDRTTPFLCKYLCPDILRGGSTKAAVCCIAS